VAAVAHKGLGLFAREDIQRLTFVCEYAGEVVGTSEAEQRLKDAEGGMNYLIVLKEHCSSGVVLTCVDPRRFGNVGRFANHSCDPNLLMVPVRVDTPVPRLALFARRDVSAGEELTFDYSGETVLALSEERSNDDAHQKTCEVLPVSVHLTALKTDLSGTKMITKDKEDHIVHDAKTNERLWQENGHTIGQTAQKSEIISLAPLLDKSPQLNGGTPILPNESADQVSFHADSSNFIKNSSAASYGCKTKRVLNSDEKSAKYCETLVDDNSLLCTQHRHEGNSVSFDCHHKKRICEVSSDARFPKNEDLVNTGVPYSGAQKPCLCGSGNCRGYLPFDREIFHC
jgi:hypothetical protein